MIYTLHLDTLSAIKNNGNPFQCTFMLGSVYKNVRSITLKSCEIPIGFYNVRSPYNTYTTETINSPITRQTTTIDEGNYTLNSLITKLGSNFETDQANQNSLKVSYKEAGKRIVPILPFVLSNVIVFDKFSNIGGSTIPTFINYQNAQRTSMYPDLGWFLGFDGNEPIINGKQTGNRSYNFSFDNYLRISFPFHGMSSREYHLTTFKVPVTVGYGGVLIYNNTIENRQTIYVKSTYNKFDRITVEVTDRFGNLISNNGLDWSLSIEIDCE